MGFLLREALRTLCGVNDNQWSYAVFWKIGCQNTNLLIWEECYFESTPSCVPAFVYGAESKINILINRMMLNSRIILVGEGIAGRAAFTGNHQWLHSNNFNRDAHPPEVVNELRLQFSAGMQTVAVIPVLPHGVIQIGSSHVIMENLGLVNDVKTLIMQLGRVPGALLSEDYRTQDSADLIGVPVSFPTPIAVNPYGTSMVADSYTIGGESRKNQINSFDHPNLFGQDCSILRQIQDNLKVTAPTFSSRMSQALTNRIDDQMAQVNSNSSFQQQPENVTARVEVIPASPASWVNQLLSDHGTDSNCHRISGQSNRLKVMEQQNLSDTGCQEHGANHTNTFKDSDASQFRNEDLMINSCSGFGQLTCDSNYVSYDSGSRSHMPEDTACEDLFDMLRIDMKSESLEENWKKLVSHGASASTKNLIKEIPTQMQQTQDMGPDFCSVSEGMSLFSGAGTDHLLDAVVSGACSGTKNISDDTIDSCKKSVTKVSTFPSPANTSSQLQELFGLSKIKAETEGSSSFQSGAGKGDSVSCSQTTSVYGSQISSWVEQAHNAKRESSVSTAYSKRNDGSAKPNRKRLKPGENPRPRPKDRQMIQDRVKELREIIPNGAKCSIDALLERTIKHMVFLQSVTKHADKLKQTGESKIIDSESGPVLKDNFDGGATWAFEVGSQSMVCPIVVEDLNPPRTFLVEMLCEERGFFLEIADWIRGLGLTILKGIMEARNNKIWARFAVEASRDVTRMEIFMSLVQLLEQTVNGGVSSLNNMIVHNSFTQTASIPATGRCQ